MTIKYYLLDNKLTADPRDQRAQVIANGNKTMNDVINEALRRGTLVTRTDLVAVTHLLFDVLCDFSAEGYNVNTPLCNLRPTVKGNFATVASIFNPTEHEIRVSLSAGTLLRERLQKATVEKVEAGNNQPLLIEFFDQESDSANDELTPGGVAVLLGSRLAFDQSGAGEGLFFVDASGAETAVPKIVKNKPGETIFVIPTTLSTGMYSLVLRSRLGGQTLKEGKLHTQIEVK